MRKLFAAVYLLVFSMIVVLLFISCSKKKDPEPLIITPITPAPRSLAVYLITPADQNFNPDHYRAIRAAMLDLQGWYRSQMGNGKTFTLNSGIVDTLRGQHPSSWYASFNGADISGDNDRQYAFFNTQYELQQLLGSRFDTLYAFFAFVDVPMRDETIPKYFHLAVEGAANMDGLLGANPKSFRGGDGHALGHAFGLPEVQPENPDALMSTGYLKYPACSLTSSEVDSLNKSPFFSVQ